MPDTVSFTSHAFGQLDKIRVGEGGQVRVTEAVVLLPLDQPIGTVIENERNKGQMLPLCCFKLLAVHHEAAVSGHNQHTVVGPQ